MEEALQQRIFKLLSILIWMLALIHLTGEIYSLYAMFYWFDIVTHFLGGLCVGIATVWLWYFSGYVRTVHIPDHRALFVALLGGICIGLIWELYEYTVWTWVGDELPVRYIPDTLLDLVMDTCGSFVGFVALKQFVFRPELQKQEQ